MSTNPFESLETRLSNIENILQDIKEQKLADTLHPELRKPVSIKRISEITNLATQTIYGLVSARKLPFYKQGKILYFFEDEIIEWIKEGKRKTTSEIQKDAMSKFKMGGNR